VLDVRVAADGQAQAALQAPTLEDLASICAGHALAEAVHTHAPPDLGLISSLGHYTYSRKYELKHQTAVHPPGFLIIVLVPTQEKLFPIREQNRDGSQL
jgi:hypothetical protein